MKQYLKSIPTKPGKRNTAGHILLTLIAFSFIHSCSFLYDGVGLSRVSGYWDDYSGNMSYTEIPARIKVQYINENPADKYSWEVLQFGCKLDNKEEIIAEVQQAGIPKKDIQAIFYKPESFDGLKLTPGKTYFVKLDLHSNYYSFLFKQNYGFAIYSWQELNDEESGPTIEPYSGWRLKYVLYAIACWLCFGLIFPTIFYIYAAQDDTREVKNFAAWLTGIFTISTMWVVYVDLPFFTGWVDWILPGIGLAICAAMAIYLRIAFRKPDLGWRFKNLKSFLDFF